MWDTAAARCTATLVGHTDSVLDGDLIPGGRFVLSCSMDGTVRLWGVSTSACYRVYRSHAPGAWVKSVLFTPDGRGFVSAGLDHRYALLVHVPLCMPSRVCVCGVWCALWHRIVLWSLAADAKQPTRVWVGHDDHIRTYTIWLSVCVP